MRASPPRRTVEAPRPPELPEKRRFPLIATIAPVVASVVLFAVTRSAFTLVFALLGPVVAVATVADSAVFRRRARSRESKRFAAELDVARREIDDAHTAERAEVDRRSPRARALVSSAEGRVGPWQGKAPSTDAGGISLRLGSGPVVSSVGFEPGHGDVARSETESLAALREYASILDAAPITADATTGVGIAGPGVAARAAARGILLQVAVQRSPATTTIIVPEDGEWDWVAGLPHSVTRGITARGIEFVTAGKALGLAIESTVAGLPRNFDVIVQLDDDGTARLTTHAAGTSHGGFRPEFVGLEMATASADALARAADRDGVAAGTASVIPDEVALADLAQPGATGRLSAAIGADASGPVVIDLVRDGPHAIVGGTTGSGKSELLSSWVLAMASVRSPDAVTFLFVDFKGGAAFDPLARLPHCVGVITDLDPGQSLRAIASLTAELRHRERLLAARSLRSIDDPGDGGEPPFPRLVVVVDEYAALVETHSRLHAVFADIAARGRSLGVHLVLCTQRPAGVVRDSILANCALRISLRMLTAADSTAVLGTDGAAALSSAPVGRALVGIAGAEPTLVQVARSSADDCEAVVVRWNASVRPRVPWLPPLPNRIPVESIAPEASEEGIPFALADIPERQAQEPAWYEPKVHGSLLVVGAAASGKSGALAALAAAPSRMRVELLPKDLPHLWDALGTAATQSDGPVRLLLLDDVDEVLASIDDGYRDALRDRIAGVLRTGRASGTYLVLTVQRVTGAIQSLAGLCGSTLLLRMPNQQEHVLAGGAVADFVEDATPGSATWRGHRVQVLTARPEPPFIPALAATDVDLETAPVTVVSSRPEEFARLLRARVPSQAVAVLHSRGYESRAEPEPAPAGEPVIRVADPEAWQAHWSSFVAALRTGNVLFDGCSTTELRTFARIRELPPPFPVRERPLWLLSADGSLSRARLC